MHHLDYLRKKISIDSDAFIKKASGRYYTGEAVGRRLARVVAEAFKLTNPDACLIRVVDPFGGDARLVDWLISSWGELGYLPVRWEISIWDINDIGFESARVRLERAAAKGCGRITTLFKVVDSFRDAGNNFGAFDIVLTNPPWELLKPDRRELQRLPDDLRDEYVSRMREYDKWIASFYPRSQPRKKFAGWGTNLSRVGLEASLRLSRKGGIIGIVLPASILADDQSVDLRRHLLTDHSLMDIAYYPAEAKLYGSADVASVTTVVRTEGLPSQSVPLLTHLIGKTNEEKATIELELGALAKLDFVLPVSFGAKAMGILGALADRFPRWHDLEMGSDDSLWAGREVDETGIAKRLMPDGDGLPLFVKGRMIERYAVCEHPKQGIARTGWNPPPSVAHARIAWRDVSRPNQKRRVIATLIPPGWAAGNSLGVAYFRNGDQTALRSLLGVMNSTTFEFQLRAHLATGHVSLSSIRKVAVPSVEILKRDHRLAELVLRIVKGDTSAEVIVDAYVAKNVYQLSEHEYRKVLELFCKVSSEECALFLDAFCSMQTDTKQDESRYPRSFCVNPKKQSTHLIETSDMSTSSILDSTTFPVQQLTVESGCKRTKRAVS